MPTKTVVTMNRYYTNNPITGNAGEITFDSDTLELRYHDGLTPNGILINGLVISDAPENVQTLVTMMNMMGAAQGIATLDSSGKVPLSQLPASIGGTTVVMNPSNLDGGFF